MATVYDESGHPIDTLAVSIDDMLLTVVARLEILDDDSLSWIARRFVGHAEECARDYAPTSEVFRAFVRCIEAIQADANGASVVVRP